MTISSRTPEGIPQRCPVCGESTAIEPSSPTGDACCPACGHLLWWFRDYQLRLYGSDAPPGLELETELASLANDSLDLVELVMELEEEFDIKIDDKDADKIQTIEDVIRYIRRRRTE